MNAEEQIPKIYYFVIWSIIGLAVILIESSIWKWIGIVWFAYLFLVDHDRYARDGLPKWADTDPFFYTFASALAALGVFVIIHVVRTDSATLQVLVGLFLGATLIVSALHGVIARTMATTRARP